ncbi:MAG: D-tyrosyl-tRNA(Tyr) deacylase [Clostridia bacterium]|nr:D-tyrosyl-tRNA(Tyr) deacylase [Clostridia bacterium]
MRVVYQRVKRAAVTADGTLTGAIEQGALLLVGVGKEDTEDDAMMLAKKCAELRVFEDESGRMNLSLLDVGGGLLVVSNFTLYGDCRRGRRPDFTSAGAPVEAKRLYECFIEDCRALGVASVQAGVFGADMAIDMVADGPVTLVIDSERLKQPKNS